MSFVTVVFMIVSIGAQLMGVALLPQTAGMTKLFPSIACALAFGVGIGALARLSYRGVELGILIPIMAAIIPLVTIGIGVIAYGENTSPLKLALLIGACGAIGWAAAL